MTAAARQERRVACLHLVQHTARRAKRDRSARKEQEFRPAVPFAECVGEGRRKLHAAIVDPHKSHTEQQLADEVGIKGAG